MTRVLYWGHWPGSSVEAERGLLCKVSLSTSPEGKACVLALFSRSCGYAALIEKDVSTDCLGWEAGAQRRGLVLVLVPGAEED